MWGPGRGPRFAKLCHAGKVFPGGSMFVSRDFALHCRKHWEEKRTRFA